MTWITLKRLLLLFWAVWLSGVVVFNATDGLKTLGVLPATFVWASGNYGAIQEVLAPFALPTALAGILFAGVIVWEAVCAALYWRSGLSFAGFRQPHTRPARRHVRRQPGTMGRVSNCLRGIPFRASLSTGSDSPRLVYRDAGDAVGHCALAGRLTTGPSSRIVLCLFASGPGLVFCRRRTLCRATKFRGYPLS